MGGGGPNVGGSSQFGTGDQGVGRTSPFAAGDQSVGRISPFGAGDQSVGRISPFGAGDQSVGRISPFGAGDQSVGGNFPFAAGGGSPPSGAGDPQSDGPESRVSPSGRSLDILKNGNQGQGSKRSQVFDENSNLIPGIKQDRPVPST
jgi:hypothetical protein